MNASISLSGIQFTPDNEAERTLLDHFAEQAIKGGIVWGGSGWHSEKGTTHGRVALRKAPEDKMRQTTRHHRLTVTVKSQDCVGLALGLMRVAAAIMEDRRQEAVVTLTADGSEVKAKWRIENRGDWNMP